MRLSARIALVTTCVALPRVDARTASAFAQQPDLVTVLQRSSAYLDAYEKQLATVIAQEDSTCDGARVGQDLKSDLMLVGISGSWVEFRDVFQVNARLIRDHQARFEALLGDPEHLLARAQQIADQSASYNVGIRRNINVPTMALTYLMRANQGRSSFKGIGSEKGATVVTFVETARPTLIHTSGSSSDTSGRFWLDPETGAVVKTELVVKSKQAAGEDRDSAVSGTITVVYDRDASLKFLVPHTMDESYEQPRLLTCRAKYSQYKAFGVVVTTATGRGGGLKSNP